MIKSYALYFAWVVSLVATGGSLFLSEVMDFMPCTLCWYQRILMYPLVILLGRAAYRNDRGIIGYALPFSILGAGFSLYHYLEQKIPALAKVLPCTQGIPCNQDYLDWFGGIVTIPFLALIAFILITIFLIAGRGAQQETAEEEEA
ncbi:disulfide oxidoreductase [Paenibacillus methanolicus]|uniref:Disulfide bond formation protein DsbB n=1 Tax=Paenibacillus methanolicus TaxID=582686 RepID=A0A5S5BWV2_9BACL|nr:disulfide oxidoreductase [Paenibacillus methanolicus]TYP70776.1 disulfide bond formation protein DsbB [Paenibacillus methanolicus]